MFSTAGAAKTPDVADHEAEVAEPPIVPLIVASLFSQMVRSVPAFTTAAVLMTSEPVFISSAHPPPAEMVLVIVYVPGVVVAISTSPVELFMNVRPDGEEEKSPALAPEGKVGRGLLPDWQ